jgi:excisionase family DNA binding protein
MSKPELEKGESVRSDTFSDEQPATRPLPKFCAHYNIGRDKAYALIHSGEIEAVKIGNRTFITRQSERRWYAKLPRLSKD